MASNPPTISAEPAGRRRRRRDRPARDRSNRRESRLLGAEFNATTGSSGVDISKSPDEENHGEETDPDDVDEVPVVRHHDRAGDLFWSEPAARQSSQQEHERNEAASNVHRVKTRCEKENRAISGRRDRHAAIAVEVVFHVVGVLKDLAADEYCTHAERQDEPLA